MDATRTGERQKHSSYIIAVLASFLCGFVVLHLGRSQFSVSSTFPVNDITAKSSHQTSPRLAVVRTFCAADALSLAESFDDWDSLTPCEHGSDMQADLFLIFSQSINTSPVAQATVDSVAQKFQETAGWKGCFDRLVSVGVDIEPEYDLYDPKQQQSNYMWVNGPNRQFERAVREVQSGLWGEYESMYLMETDSRPVKTFWLDSLVLDVNEQRPFAILGSKYKGDKWDSFYSQLPTALVNHINGNAVYNLTHPLLNLIVDELEEEAQTAANAIPYDYRIAQIMEEGISGNAPDFPKVHAPQELPSKTTTFSSWVHLEGNPIKETKMLANYAATNILPAHVSRDEVVVHGANMYEPWNAEKIGDISLIVSDWDDSNANVLLSLLQETHHPFSRVMVMLPTDATLELPKISIPIDVYHRGTASDYMDICTAPIVTKWFMMTNSYHRVKPNVQLMMNKGDDGTSKPVISYAPVDEENCLQYQSCAQDLNMAKKIFPQADRAFRNDDMVFSTENRNHFCDMWKTRFSSETRAAPSASSYVAHLQKEGNAEALYTFSDRTVYGSRDTFVRLPAENLSPTLRAQATWTSTIKSDGRSSTARKLGAAEAQSATDGRNLIAEEAPLNETNACTLYVEESDCLNAECDWNAQFDSCRSALNNERDVNGPNPIVEGTNSGGLRGQPQWAQALIGTVIAAGCVLVIGLVGVTTYKGMIRSRTNSEAHGDGGDVNLDDDEINDFCTVDDILQDLEGAQPEPTTGATAEQILRDLDPFYTFQNNDDAVEFTRRADSSVVEL